MDGKSDIHTDIRRPGVDPDDVERTPGMSDGHANFQRPRPSGTSDNEEAQKRQSDQLDDTEVDCADSANHSKNSGGHISCGAPGT
jgi:hypothetical protein